ncbi:MAG TPA: hypothetical protein VFM70_00015, partial [Salinimicrobium sp.]|nr:hypothetical protein [Salinimicrobium sp.]
MKKDDLEIVFFHELGHFIAQELNYEIYGLGKVESIKFVKYEFANEIRYQGQTIPVVPANASRNDKLINLPEKIAELIYGCYFQAIFTGEPLKSCFDIYNENSKGYYDAKDIAGGLYQFNIEKERKILYPYLREEYFGKLKNKKTDFTLL